MDGKKTKCPLLKVDCLEETCAWWDYVERRCGVMDLPKLATGMQKEMAEMQKSLNTMKSVSDYLMRGFKPGGEEDGG